MDKRVEPYKIQDSSLTPTKTYSKEITSKSGVSDPDTLIQAVAESGSNPDPDPDKGFS
jgi:hypothetical protein